MAPARRSVHLHRHLPERDRSTSRLRRGEGLHLAGAVGTYDAAVVTKDAAGKVHVNKDEMATRHGAWGGAAVGALVGILFPPSIIAVGCGWRSGRRR